MPLLRSSSLAAAFALTAVVVAAPRTASACGGTFCDGAGAGPQVMSVDQSGESILFVMEDGFVEAHVQIEYTGDPAQFAWIVPIMAEPEISVGSQELIERTLAATVPTFTVSTTFEGDCTSESPGLGCVAASEDVAAGGDDGFFEDEPPPMGAPTVRRTDVVGAFEYAVLQGGTVDGIGQWLDDNGYARDDEAPKILQAYLDEGFMFVAFKLVPGAGIDQIHPVVLRYAGSEPCIPLRLTRIAAVEDMKVRAFFLGQSRVVPTNYRHVELNPLRIDWVGLGANYDELVSEAVDQEGANGRAFVTEYAGPSSVVDRSGLVGLGWDSSAFAEVTAATLTEKLEWQRLIGCDLVTDPNTGVSHEECGAKHPLLIPLLRTYFPKPVGVTDEDFYQCTTCYEVDESEWDAAGFVDAFEEQIVAPAEHAAEVLGEHGYLTRLFTMISPGEMTIDPLFHERSDLPLVSNQWTATNVIHCEEPDRYDLPDGRSIYLDDAGSFDLSEMSAAASITEIPAAGAPMALLDATPAIAGELADWNAAHGPADGGCECRASHRRMNGAGWMSLLLLLGLRLRGRRARPVG